jgi:GrpB-like predicted nucleotidyltransferase (UPF0157 family)
MNATSPPETVELSAYSPMWPAVFEMEKERLGAIFAEDSARIEHVGSTAVPGLGAKPIIDIVLGAPSLANIERRIAALVESGYRYVPEFEQSIPDRRYFVKRHGQPGYFHLHAVVHDSPFWRDQIAFRDLLRTDPGYVERYWRLKTALAARFRNDREAYANAKSNFIREALAQARGLSA